MPDAIETLSGHPLRNLRPCVVRTCLSLPPERRTLVRCHDKEPVLFRNEIEESCVEKPSKLRCHAHQPCALGGSYKRPIGLVCFDAELVLPPAVSREGKVAVRLVPKRLAHIEDESLLGKVFRRSHEPRTQRFTGLTATLRPVDG
jgi:hypothetical protein